MSRATPHVRSAILSDDVRTEFNGKHIIIGTYGPEIGIPHFPVHLNFRLTLIVDFIDEKEFELNIRIIGPAGDEVASFQSDVSVARPGKNVPLPTIGFATPFSSAGSIKIESYEKGEWNEVGEWQVLKAEPTNFQV